MSAINLYMKAGLPARAARLAASREVRNKYSLSYFLGCIDAVIRAKDRIVEFLSVQKPS